MPYKFIESRRHEIPRPNTRSRTGRSGSDGTVINSIPEHPDAQFYLMPGERYVNFPKRVSGVLTNAVGLTAGWG
jgi:hypothetical protein